ncbi:MAG: hypothetical protein EPN40_05280 [Rhodanobacteraceae bacterium]|nr:MAG: hypothetical protein EPN40_05280 [Rhodanobacteraceae bacterium]
MPYRFQFFLRLLALVSVVAFTGCQTIAPTSSPAAASRPMTLCDAPAVHAQCVDVLAATHWPSMVVVGNALEINPLVEALMPTIGVGSSADVTMAVRVLGSPANDPLVIVDHSEKFRLAVLRAALVRVKAPLTPRDVAIVVKDPSHYADLQAQATSLGLRLWLIPASRQ